MKKINVDQYIIVIKTGLNKSIISIFIDDIKKITVKNNKKIKQIKLKLIFTFFVIDISPISFYLSLKLEQNRENWTIKMSQSVYIHKIFNKFYHDKASIIYIPIKKTIFFEQKTKGKVLLFVKKCYQGLIGFLIFFKVEIKLNIAFVIFVASWFAKNLGYKYTKAVKMILQYLKGLKKMRNYQWR